MNDPDRRRRVGHVRTAADGIEGAQAPPDALPGANEPLRVVTEELESAGKDLQSLHEALATAKEDSARQVEELRELSAERQPEAQQDVRAAQADAEPLVESLLETIHEPVIALHPDLTVMSVNKGFCEHFRVTREEAVGRGICDLGNGQWDTPSVRRLLEDLLPSDERVEDYRVTLELEAVGRRTMLANARHLDPTRLPARPP